jgi:DNA-binding XRE family transcriptional regulator
MERIEKTIFLSYRRTNIPWALAIFQNLTHNGYDLTVTGAELKELRLDLGLTQEEFAKRLHVSRRTIGRAEKDGTKRISHILEL